VEPSVHYLVMSQHTRD